MHNGKISKRAGSHMLAQIQYMCVYVCVCVCVLTCDEGCELAVQCFLRFECVGSFHVVYKGKRLAWEHAQALKRTELTASTNKHTHTHTHTHTATNTHSFLLRAPADSQRTSKECATLLCKQSLQYVFSVVTGVQLLAANAQ